MAGRKDKEQEREARWRRPIFEFVVSLSTLPTSVYLAKLVARAMRHKNAYLRELFRYELLKEHIRTLMERDEIDEVLGSRSAYAKLALAPTKLPEDDKGWERFQKVIEVLGPREAFRLFDVTSSSRIVVTLTFKLRKELYTELSEEKQKKVRDAIGNKRALSIEEPPEGFLEGKSLEERRRSN